MNLKISNQSNQEIYQIITTNQEAIKQLMFESNADGIANLHTESARLLPPQGDFVMGKQNIKFYWQKFLEQTNIQKFQPEIIELEFYGQTIAEIGVYTINLSLKSDNDQVMEDRGKYLMIWKYDDHQWLIHYDAWSSI